MIKQLLKKFKTGTIFVLKDNNIYIFLLDKQFYLVDGLIHAFGDGNPNLMGQINGSVYTNKELDIISCYFWQDAKIENSLWTKHFSRQIQNKILFKKLFNLPWNKCMSIENIFYEIKWRFNNEFTRP